HIEIAFHISRNLLFFFKKVLPYISPKCKDTGKLFKGYSVFKIILGAIKMQRFMKKTKNET
ncbi:MAG: hypothetical protein ACFFDW_15925, partial [Candidatus Thorarchaeota archaeon]